MGTVITFRPRQRGAEAEPSKGPGEIINLTDERFLRGRCGLQMISEIEGSIKEPGIVATLIQWLREQISEVRIHLAVNRANRNE